ncbi:hypothetical protein JOB18_039959 [Solea senegalensis]|uniref:Uncharacterized protein n=1 Tax=Solea senegalensis TaxID=28829 RepID=A0AAV6QRV5_SOLSE|nr:hypothetical protein JOB18_039959 [Solea senegalensis]
MAEFSVPSHTHGPNRPIKRSDLKVDHHPSLNPPPSSHLRRCCGGRRAGGFPRGLITSNWEIIFIQRFMRSSLLLSQKRTERALAVAATTALEQLLIQFYVRKVVAQLV